MARTEKPFNPDPAWPEYLAQYEPLIEALAKQRIADPALRDDAMQLARMKLMKIHPGDSHHYAAYLRGEKSEEDWQNVLRYLCQQAIGRAIHSAAVNKATRRWGEQDPVHEPWPVTTQRDGDTHDDIEFPAAGPDPSEIAERNIDFRRMVLWRGLSPFQREALVMWSWGFQTGAIARILGHKYRGRALTESTIRYHVGQGIEQLRGRFAHAA